MSLWDEMPSLAATEEEVAAWVADALIAIDGRPHERNWRYRAVGAGIAEVMSDPGLREARLDIKVPVGEMRMVKMACENRGIVPRTYLRRAMGSMLVVCDGLQPEDVPSLLNGGMLRPM